ncbi:fibronectin type III domain-containing protein, partial [candidate division KSB1 bacterium]|nr:fibronectin type III domain-containing protein [candidate division KSB1 bacterium]
MFPRINLKFSLLFVCLLILFSNVFSQTTESPLGGFTYVYSGVTVSPNPIPKGQNFQVTFSVRETTGESVTLAEVTCAVLDANGNHLFNLATKSNITVPANGTYTYNASGYTNTGYLSNPGTYKAMARARVPGGNWWDWQTTGSGINPRTFQVVSPQPGSVSLSKTTVEMGGTLTVSWSGWPGNVNVAVYKGGNFWVYSDTDRSGTGQSVYDITTQQGWEVRNDYQVKIILRSDESVNKYSNTFKVTASPLSAPSNLVALADGSSVSLTWRDNSNNESGFKIQRKTGDSGSWSQVATRSANSTSWTNTGVSLNQKYYYQVCAYNSSTQSGFSPFYYAFTMQSPSNLNATAVSANQINLTWTDRSTNETGFKIERRVSGGSWTEIGYKPSGQTSYQDTGLSSGQTYYYRVRAYRDSGQSTPHYSSFSSEANAKTFGSGSVSLSKTTVEMGGTLTVSWSGWPGNVNVAVYKGGNFWVYSDTDRSGTGQSVYDITTQQGWEVRNDYQVKIILRSDESVNKYSNTFKVTASPLSAPSNLVALADGSSVSLTWRDNSNNESGFKIQRKTGDSGSWSQVATRSANSTSWTNTGVSLNQKYYYQVCAYNSSTQSGFSPFYYAFTMQSPSNLNATAVSANQINLTWTDRSTNETGFKIERRVSGGSWTEIGYKPSGQTSYQDTGLSSGQTYYYRVRAYRDSGQSTPHYSSFSSEVNATTFGVVNPTVYVDKSKIYPNDTITESGEGFTPGGLAELHFIYPDGTASDKTKSVNAYGKFTNYWTPDNNSQIGTYRYWADDLSSGKKAPEVTFEVARNEQAKGSIKGGISDDINRTPLTNATVILKSGSQTLDSKAVHPISAVYEFNNIAVGIYVVEAQAPGYVNNSRTIQVYEGQTAQGNITLKQQGSAPDNQAQFISKSISDGTVINAGTQFQQIFKFKNIGGNTWRYYKLKRTSGNAMGSSNLIDVPETVPNSDCEMKLDFTAPANAGIYDNEWQLQTSGNVLFGPKVTTNITVNAVVARDDAKFVKYDGSSTIVEVKQGQLYGTVFIFNNAGNTNWEGYLFKKVTGSDNIVGPDQQEVQATAPGENQSFLILGYASQTPGTYRSEWQLKNKSGTYFGDKATFSIRVVPIEQPTNNEGLGTNTDSYNNGAASSEPVNLANGNYYYEHVDLKLEGPLGTEFKRTYNAQDNYDGPLGNNWTHNFNTMLSPTDNGPTLLRTG